MPGPSFPRKPRGCGRPERTNGVFTMSEQTSGEAMMRSVVTCYVPEEEVYGEEGQW